MKQKGDAGTPQVAQRGEVGSHVGCRPRASDRSKGQESVHQSPSPSSPLSGSTRNAQVPSGYGGWTMDTPGRKLVQYNVTIRYNTLL